MLDILDLTAALRNDEFFIAYQPLFDARTHIPECMEALLRWHCPGKGTVPPDAFIHLIEGTPLEKEVVDWMLRTTWPALQQWRMHLHNLAIAINVSPLLLTRQLVDLIERHWPAPTQLEIEVTERLPLAAHAEAIETIANLKALGVNVLFDDFCGTSCCTNRLAMLPFNGIKFDRSLIPPPPAYDFERLMMLSKMAKREGLITTAEGMEHAGQIIVAQLAGIHRWQGYFGARPMTEGATSAWLKERAYLSIHKAIERHSFGTANQDA